MFKFRELTIIQEALTKYLDDQERWLSYCIENHPENEAENDRLQSTIDAAQKLVEKINNLTL